VTTSLAVLLIVIIGGGYVAWRWSQDQYYVGADSKGQVVIYRGVNQHIAGISLSKPYRQTGILLSQVPSPYQQTVTATDAASSLSDAQDIVGNVRTAVSTCKQQYTALAAWVIKENQYEAKLSLARKNSKKTTKGITPPGPQPQKAAMCPPSQTYGIPASAITPSASGQS
jgi:protein phosphatase